MVRDDPILGLVRLCAGCGEEWPLDDEFWHMDGDRLAHAWPHRCRACCVDYYAERRRIALREKRTHWTAKVPIAGTCGKPMRGGFCGRRPGHRYECRTRYAMDNARDARRVA